MNNSTKKRALYAKPSYTESSEVAGARAKAEEIEAAAPGEYVSGWQDSIKELADAIVSGEKFSYDFNADPIYHSWREKLARESRRAAKNAAANAAALTGGYANSFSATAAEQASGETIAKLQDLIPELYDAAFARWRGEREAKRGDLASLLSLENADYGKWRDSVADYQRDRDYYLGKYNTASSRDYSAYLDALGQWNVDRDYERRVYEYDADAAYKAARAAAEDEARARELELKQKQYELEVTKAAQAAAAAAARYSSTVKTVKTTKTTKSQSINDVVTSDAGRRLLSFIGTGNALDSSGRVRASFLESCESAKKEKRISTKEYNAIMDYLSSNGYVK